MNEWFKNVLGKVKELWSKWKPVQKIILIGIVVAVVVVIIVTARVSAKPSTVRLFNAPVTDEVTRNKILDRLDEANVRATVDDSGYIYVADDKTKRHVVPMLNDENLLPSNVDIWSDYFTRSWSTTDADQNVKLKVKKQEELKKFIENYSDIKWADVKIEIPNESLFISDQNPVKCSVILAPVPGSSILTERKRIEGIQRAVLAAVDGLKAEELIITDTSGTQVNDFQSLAELDRLTITEKTERFKMQYATQIRAKILTMFQDTYTVDRCRDMVVTIEMDTSERTSQSTEYTPIVIKEDNPDTPYDDSEYRDYLPVSSQTITKTWQGTSANPEGPAGVEGQNPPVYSDMSNVTGKSTETGVTQNNALNTKTTQENTAPQINKISVSVNIDGRWRKLYEPGTKKPIIDEYGSIKREYTSLTPFDISEAERSIRGGIGYDRNRGDLVVVTNIPYDRDAQFAEEDAIYFAKLQRQKMFVIILISIVVVLVGFILFRVISKEIERRRREREARLLAEQQAARERALWDAKEEGMEVTMSVEETRRMELQENAITMAKEHPEDVALLIRTWLMEE